MTQTENNKLIAQFEGHKINFGFDGEGILYLEHHISVHKLRYHKDWNWLIPIIDKIYSSNEYIDYCNALSQFGEGIIINTKFISETYQDVLDFIEWYNQNGGQNKNR